MRAMSRRIIQPVKLLYYAKHGLTLRKIILRRCRNTDEVTSFEEVRLSGLSVSAGFGRLCRRG